MSVANAVPITTVQSRVTRFSHSAKNAGLPISLTDSRDGQIDWAADSRRMIIQEGQVENDSDIEYPCRAKLPSPISNLDGRTRTFYIGDLGIALPSPLRLASIVLPHGLSPAFRRILNVINQHPSIFCQPVLAAFLLEGHFVRYIRLMGETYQHRRGLFNEGARRILSR